MELSHEAGLAARLLVAALLGAAVGLERELHGHPAGMRTHLLVSVGSSLFTILSIYGFVGVLEGIETAPVDPSRVAAQIVSGIGFLGAGAILKDGFTIRGLTTAASLWATAAIGMAAGAGVMALALVTTGIVVLSLWPLHLVAVRLHGLVAQKARIQITAASMDAVERAEDALRRSKVDIGAVRTERTDDGIVADLDVQSRDEDLVRAAAVVARIEGIRVVDTGEQE
jgi:putative Mg2+ transporter-C (MgtC) family protein